MTYIRHSRGNCQGLPRRLPKQIKRIVRLLQQKDCRGTAEVNDAFKLLSLPTTLWMKFERWDQTTDLLESSRRPGTLHHYKTEWRKWGSWCLSGKIDPTSTGVNCVLEFLSNLFSEGLEYRTINGYRSAISAYHEKAEGSPIGQHPKVCHLLIFCQGYSVRDFHNQNTAIWDISKVIDYISTLGNNQILSTKIITSKLTTLMANLSSNRASELTYLDIWHIAIKENSVIFHFSKLTKTWK